jgi:cation:H+ antiporter
MDLSLFETCVLALGSIGFGLILLMRGGDWTVDSAVVIAERFGISPLIIGFTVLAAGTSLPELIVSMLANIQDAPGIAIGNVLGSNIANIAFVLSVAAIISPLIVKSKAVRRDLIFMLLATGLFAGLMQMDAMNRVSGAAMIVLLVLYVAYQYRKAKAGAEIDPALLDKIEKPAAQDVWVATLWLAMGLVAIAIGAEFLVRGARVGADVIGVPDAVIGLSLVALGTSLPELSTSIIAARKGHADMVLGNIVGSNVFNILMIMGLVMLLKPIGIETYAAQLVEFDIWVTLIVTLIFVALMFMFKKMGRFIAVAFCAFYILYNIYIYAIYVA